MVLLVCGLGIVSAQATRQEMTIAVETSVSTFDCWFTNENLCLYMSKLWGDTLVNVDPNDPSRLLPGLAEAWEFTDPSTLRMTLQRDVEFHNGEPFNAEAVRATLEFMADPENGSLLNYAVNWLSEVRIIDDYTIDLVYKAPNPPGLQRLAQLGTIYPPSHYFAVGSGEFGTAPVGTGPYRLVRWIRDQEVVFEANENYFGGTKGQPRLDQITVRFIPEQATRIAELLAGSVDVITEVAPDQAQFVEASGLVVTPLPTNALVYLSLDSMGRSGQTPLTDQRVRQAIAHSIDRQAIVDNVLSGFATRADVLATPYMFGYSDDIPVADFNPQRARELLTEAGYPDGFSIDYVSWIPQRQALEAVVAYLADVGIRANLNYFGADVSSANQIITSGNAPMSSSLWTTIFDADAILAPHFSKGAARAYTDDPEIQGWLSEAASIVDSERRAELYSLVLTKISEQAYMVPLFSPQILLASKPGVDLTSVISPDAPRFYALGWAD